MGKMLDANMIDDILFEYRWRKMAAKRDENYHNVGYLVYDWGLWMVFDSQAACHDYLNNECSETAFWCDLNFTSEELLRLQLIEIMLNERCCG